MVNRKLGQSVRCDKKRKCAACDKLEQETTSGDNSNSGKSTGNLVRALDVIRRGSVLLVINSYRKRHPKDIEEYCVSDVHILTESCLKFGDLLISETQVCPVMEATTIASACNEVYGRNSLKPNTIGIIPKRWRDNQSKIANQ
ncbi:hypothetical protein JTB14_004161 [Gonioctena quinquepunctata]|nr:hypothetical protein JTB14_004161 [Gonioctena quinquepunctata]